MKKNDTTKLREQLEKTEIAFQIEVEKARLDESKRVERENRTRQFLRDLQQTAISHFLKGHDERARVLRDAARRGFDLLFPNPTQAIASRSGEEAQR